jgi:hypothetical protein
VIDVKIKVIFLNAFFTLMMIAKPVLADSLTRSDCQRAMSFLGFNLTAVAQCEGIVVESDIPDLRRTAEECNEKFGEDFVAEAAASGIREFKEILKLQDNNESICRTVTKELKESPYIKNSLRPEFFN